MLVVTQMLVKEGRISSLDRKYCIAYFSHELVAVCFSVWQCKLFQNSLQCDTTNFIAAIIEPDN